MITVVTSGITSMTRYQAAAGRASSATSRDRRWARAAAVGFPVPAAAGPAVGRAALSTTVTGSRGLELGPDLVAERRAGAEVLGGLELRDRVGAGVDRGVAADRRVDTGRGPRLAAGVVRVVRLLALDRRRQDEVDEREGRVQMRRVLRDDPGVDPELAALGRHDVDRVLGALVGLDRGEVAVPAEAHPQIARLDLGDVVAADRGEVRSEERRVGKSVD